MRVSATARRPLATLGVAPPASGSSRRAWPAGPASQRSCRRAGAAQGDPPAFDPDAKKLKAGGKGAKARKRLGDREVLELTNAGRGITSASLTVYATASAAAAAASG